MKYTCIHVQAWWKQYFIDLVAYSGPRVGEGPPLHHLNKASISFIFTKLKGRECTLKILGS